MHKKTAQLMSNVPYVYYEQIHGRNKIL